MSESATRWVPGPAWLFCPANRADRYVKALAAADIVILDLEDAVAGSQKGDAREAVHRLSAEGTLDLDRTVVRVNASGTTDHRLDSVLVSELGVRRVMLAKAQDPHAVASLACEVILLIETPLGVERAWELAQVDNVVGAMWGADDLVAAMGGTTSRHPGGRYRDVSRYARSRTLIAAKSAERLALDAVHMDIADVDGLEEECNDAVASGFDGTVAIHPAQLASIRRAYRPASEQVDWARRLLAFVGDSRGVTTFEGRMVDGPVFSQAERILRLSEGVS